MNIHGIAFLWIVVLSVPASSGAAPAGVPIPHAHNDYLRERPLADALQRGFASIEVDIFTSGGRFLVAHRAADLRSERSLTGLYLDPLDRMARRGELDRDITLLLDAKSVSARGLRDLDDLLSHYSETVSHRDGRAWTRGRIAVLLSGDGLTKRAGLGAGSPRFFAIEGRLSDLGAAVDTTVMPQVATNWRTLFSWRGRGEMPKSERERLAAIVTRGHGERRRLRFWNTPDDTTVWRALMDAGVDVIGADDLARLEAFLKLQAGERAR